MLGQLVRYRSTIWYLALRQTQDRYAGTLGGLFWAVLQPIMLLAVFWFVFEKGLRIGTAGGRPFVLELFCALVPWMLVQESLSGAAVSITGRPYLVKKIAFPSEILPITNIASALLTQAVLYAVLFAMLIGYGRLPGAGLLLFPYYFVCLLVLVAGIAILVSAANVFYRDIGQFLAVALNLWFWITPIVWPVSMLPTGFEWIVELNPLAYVMQGYRNSLLEPSIVLPGAVSTAFFWLIAGGIYLFATRTFMRLKPSFADVI